MSNIKVQGNASGTGSLTIAAPNTNTDRTLTLPDESGTLLSSGGPVSIGGLVTLNNGGIKFPASQVASTDANTLDDYEEGTWTPGVQGSLTSGTYTPINIIATYTKIGRSVILTCYFGLSAASGGAGYLQITGIPFAKKSGVSCWGATRLQSVDFDANCKYVSCAFITTSATSVMYFDQVVDNGSAIDLPISAITTSSTLGFSITYLTE